MKESKVRDVSKESLSKVCISSAGDDFFKKFGIDTHFPIVKPFLGLSVMFLFFVPWIWGGVGSVYHGDGLVGLYISLAIMFIIVALILALGKNKYIKELLEFKKFLNYIESKFNIGYFLYSGRVKNIKKLNDSIYISDDGKFVAVHRDSLGKPEKSKNSVFIFSTADIAEVNAISPEGRTVKGSTTYIAGGSGVSGAAMLAGSGVASGVSSVGARIRRDQEITRVKGGTGLSIMLNDADITSIFIRMPFQDAEKLLIVFGKMESFGGVWEKVSMKNIGDNRSFFV